MDTHELPTMHGPECEAAAPEAAREPARSVGEPLLALDFAINAGVRYHAKRRAWFDTLHRLAMGVIALGASAAVAALAGGLVPLAAKLALAVALAAALDLLFGFSERAREEDSLYRRSNALAAEIADAKSVDADLLRLWDKRRLLIRADSADRLLVLQRICFNLEAEARGFAEEALYDVTPLQRLFAPLWSLPPHRPRRLAL